MATPTNVETPDMVCVSVEHQGDDKYNNTGTFQFHKYPDMGNVTNYILTVNDGVHTNTYYLTNADNLDTTSDKRYLWALQGMVWHNTYTLGLQVQNPVSIQTPLIAPTYIMTPGETPTPNGWTGFNFNLSNIFGTPVMTTTPGVLPVQVVQQTTFFPTAVPVGTWQIPMATMVAQVDVDLKTNTQVVNVNNNSDEYTWHWRQHHCETVKFGHYNSTLTAGSTAIYGIYNPSSTQFLHPRIFVSVADGTAQLWVNKMAFGAAGTTLTARTLEMCTPITNIPKVYYAPTPIGTPTDANQSAEMIFSGGSDQTNPNGSKSGNQMGVQNEDWFDFAPLGSYVIRVVAGATDIKYEIAFGFYQDIEGQGGE